MGFEEFLGDIDHLVFDGVLRGFILPLHFFKNLIFK